MAPKAILLDHFDGVIADTENLHVAALAADTLGPRLAGARSRGG